VPVLEWAHAKGDLLPRSEELFRTLIPFLRLVGSRRPDATPVLQTLQWAYDEGARRLCPSPRDSLPEADLVPPLVGLLQQHLSASDRQRACRRAMAAPLPVVQWLRAHGFDWGANPLCGARQVPGRPAAACPLAWAAANGAPPPSAAEEGGSDGGGSEEGGSEYGSDGSDAPDEGEGDHFPHPFHGMPQPLPGGGFSVQFLGMPPGMHPAFLG